MTTNDTRGLWRGKRLNNGEWVQGLLMYRDFSNNSASLYQEAEHNGIWIDPSTLGECTGLRDKNGKLIFEGDIIHLWGGEHYSGYWEHDKVTVVEDITDGVCVSIGETEYVEIIGNIHDTPELLKGADKPLERTSYE